MYRKIIKVFLGSPGDLEEERKVAKSIVDEENSNHANRLNYHIELVGWEDTVSQRRRAQDAINVDLDQCEYFVGLIWKKWGTPPGPEGHPYSSGFEEEYRRSVARHDKTGKPQISLLLKSIAKDDLIDAGKQLKKVIEFQEEINNEKKQYYQKFEDLRDFEQKFRATIAKFLRDQKSEDDELESSAPQKPSTVKKDTADQRASEGSKGIFDGGARDFLDDFLSKEDTTDAYSAAEAARFRLLASTVNHTGNDGLVLGPHDSNLIYRDLRNANLSEREKRGLLSSGLENLGSCTVPLWHWLFNQTFKPQYELPIRTISGSDLRRRNTFKVLEKLSITPDEFEGPLKQINFSEIWFADDTSDDLVVAALEYLGSVGDKGIEVDWPKLIANSEANIARAAVRASAQIAVRSSTTEALRFASQHESTDLGDNLAELLLANIRTIETDVLRNCLQNKTTAFLKGIASELSNRAALTRSDVQLLCENADADIRLIGVRAATKFEPVPTLTDARKLLVKPRKTNGLALFTPPNDRDRHGEEAFEEYKVDFLSKQSLHDLQELQKDESLYSTDATLALYYGHFRKIKSQLVGDLLDGFERFSVERRNPLMRTSAEPSASTFNFVRTELLQSAFEIFCSKATKTDIETIRTVVDTHDIKFSTEIASFLMNYGEWADLLRIAKLSEKQKYGFGFSLLSSVDHSSAYQLTASSILKLGSRRIADAWKLKMPVPVREQLVIQMPKNLFSAFDNQSIVEMLLTESDLVREIVALKSVLCLSKARLNYILNAYYNVEGSYYYNTIFWLDLGISADRSTSLAVARKAIEEKSR